MTVFELAHYRRDSFRPFCLQHASSAYKIPQRFWSYLLLKDIMVARFEWNPVCHQLSQFINIFYLNIIGSPYSLFFPM